MSRKITDFCRECGLPYVYCEVEGQCKCTKITFLVESDDGGDRFRRRDPEPE